MPSLVYIKRETAIVFNGEVGADAALSAEGLANNAGRVSARYDLGSGSTTDKYEWRCFASWQATPTKGGALELRLAQSDGTEVDGDVGTTDAALGSEDQLVNLQYVGSVRVETANTTKMVASGTCIITSRYVSVVPFNRGGSALNATDSNFKFILTPIPDEIQDAT